MLWGAATSAYQIEGAVAEDGRAPSIWDVFSHASGGDTGDVATDHYHRWPEDVALMAELGLDAYRFSVAWQRVQPEGRGRPNQRGLDFYRRLVEALRARGITPLLTLYHWDLPQALEERGGWRDRDTAGRFADYAELVHRALGDLVTFWTTLNEPWCAAFLGHSAGVYAPGLRDPAAALTAAHHLLLAHGMGVQALRAAGAEQVSITLNLTPVDPLDGEDEDAARRIDGLQNRWFLDPVRRGAYPQDVVGDVEGILDTAVIRDGDETVIGTPIDVLGVNYYYSLTVTSGSGPRDEPCPWPGASDVEVLPPEPPLTAMGWPIEPEGLTRILVRVHEEYGVPVLVTENGAAFPDVPAADGRVHDPDRVGFLEAHVAALRAAQDQGVDVRGYCVWSLLDNFEWAEGYSKRFGLVYVDYPTCDRIPKDSFRWYRELITTSP